MSLIMEILEGLWNTTAYYKGMRINIFGFPMPWKQNSQYSQKSAANTIVRLNKNGLVEVQGGKWLLTEKGKEYFKNKRKLGTKFTSPFILNAPKNLLLMFDIPESKRAERHWLRWHLKEFQYYMIQQSVWVGPSPLPKKFGFHLKETGLDKYIKTFKLSKPYQI
ncbi:MAG: CRISPR-associated endonuclease Cas2 [Candidatus Zambryskibacteria bacterium RIFOXYC1_FULL_39_10]|uniref:CRISPR-associated endonuclease Cas2 n=1 Tax=Candidatus Zambryskibacteria bacterium RIFOXYC1_FULL_39_10 TaxID=1802779 RepID=A0A1G2UYU1_9BACT|nr:MAG: CRISPR-associated endonuclease Cas2 [Candidatus Zambryskibacteria bacterium RIFOXYC1_FULL_39_10]OHB15448.1 MAG: CRISPR-associated endonuclease Cas2 [Candidatus Zambryskibacteria bacterium RIFOXYD1_FULL_39_35]